ncbi:YeeE/YedE thiosulfate transporter family protein [soil metagenome]
MFRFGGSHMYGILGSAVLVAGVSVRLIRRLGWTGSDGKPLRIGPKEPGRTTARLAGGFAFGCGWALLGGVSRPDLRAHRDRRHRARRVARESRSGWLYGPLRPRLPHYRRSTAANRFQISRR